ncbi:MAG: hypothetical protein JNK21_00660, partial [Rhodospirillaceae bacterium]|nr:hypothetical protein [Rhodospirillaceae bacterium]
MSFRFQSAAALLCLACALPAFAQTPPNCFASGLTAPQRIAACTATLNDAALPAGTKALAYFARGEALSDTGETARALADLNAGLAIAPSDTTALLARSKLKEAQGDLAGAETDTTAAIMADGTLGEAYVR